MKQTRERVTWQSFDEDGRVTHESSELRWVYHYDDGRMRVNFLKGRRPVIREDCCCTRWAARQQQILNAADDIGMEIPPEVALEDVRHEDEKTHGKHSCTCNGTGMRLVAFAGQRMPIRVSIMKWRDR